MFDPKKATVAMLVVVGAVLVPALLAPAPSLTTPYVSALSQLIVSTTHAATGCEGKKCEINSAGSQSKCVASAGTSCQVQSVQGRGHGHICQTLTCF